MANSGAMAEFARWPTERKVLAFAAVGLVLGLLYWRFGYRSLQDKLEAAQSEHASKLATNRRLAEDIPKFEQLRTHMTRLRELIEKNQTALPSEAEVPAFFETLQHKVNESGVEIRKWTNRAEEPVESFVKVPVEVEMTGTFMQIKRFFASLIQSDVRGAQGGDRPVEDHQRIVSIENLALSNPTVRNREIVLTAKFTAVTFRQEDKTAAPGTAGAPRPPTRPATAPTTAPPPLPSASAPPAGKPAADGAPGRNTGSAAGPGAGSDRLKGGL